MRERIEDLGRLAVLIRKTFEEHPLFDRNWLPGRCKDYYEWFESLSEDRRDDVIQSWVYGINEIKEDLAMMLEIAEGTDRLNYPVDLDKSF